MPTPTATTPTTTTTLPTFESLYETYYPRIYQHALRLVRNVHDAEDVTQDTFVKAFISLPSFDPSRGSVVTWLYTIATHAAYDYKRRSQVRASTYSLDDLMYEVADEEQADPQTRYNGSTEQAVTALKYMQPHYREALLMRGAGYSLDELAAHFGKTERTIRGWLTEARHMLTDEQEECA